MTNISDNYRELQPSEIDEAFRQFGEAWKSPTIPALQYELAVKPELEKFAAGGSVAPYDAFIRCLKKLDLENSASTALLDVGASSGYYSEVLRIAGFNYLYFGMDFSPAFYEFAHLKFPGILFKQGDACAIPYGRRAFHVVVSGGCLMHSRKYQDIIAECTRVSSRYVIFHRTPVFTEKPTAYFIKEAYGLPVCELQFNEQELLGLFRKYGLKLVHTEDVFFNDGFGHRNYVLDKLPVQEVEHHPV